MLLAPYQVLGLDHITDLDRAALWAGMGMRKTSTSLTALRAIEAVEGGPALAIGTKRIALSTWPDEAKKWGFDEVVPLIGTPAERQRAVKRDCWLHSVNYDNLPWLVQHWGDKWPYRTVVADEATRLKGFRLRQGGKRTAALGRVAFKHTKRFIQLTGTPSPNGVRDLWGQMWFLDQGERLGRTFSAFDQRWFTTSYDGWGIEPRPGAYEEILDLISDLCLTIEAKDWFDLKDPIVTNIYVDLPPAARKLYRDMERELFAQIDGRTAEAFNAAGKTNKCLQLANGAIYVDPRTEEDQCGSAREWKVAHDAKLDALDSIITEAAGAPVLVAYQYKSDLARLLRAFPQARALDADPRTLAEWNANRIPVLLAHPASAGHGLNLQDGGNILVYFSHWWNLEERLQILERIGPTRQAQSGHDRNVFVYNIIARDTIDEDVIARTDGKRSVQDVILERMKRRTK